MVLTVVLRSCKWSNLWNAEGLFKINVSGDGNLLKLWQGVRDARPIPRVHLKHTPCKHTNRLKFVEKVLYRLSPVEGMLLRALPYSLYYSPAARFTKHL